MGSKSETGHAVNADNFEKLYYEAKSQGTKYNPQDPEISEPNLKIKLDKAVTSRATFRDKAGPWMKAVNDREAAMAPVDKLMTQVKNAADVSLGSEQFKKDVAGYVKKIHGERIGVTVTTDPNDPNIPTDETIEQISVSHVGYANKTENIGMLIALLVAESGYGPNETELQPGALGVLYDKLKANNTKVAELAPDMKNARNDFKNELYHPTEGIFDLQKRVKKYFKSVFGGNSVQYHDVAKLKFVDLS